MIVPLTPDHAPAAARLHIAGQPGTFLTALGPEVLTVLYAQLPQSAHGFGFAAADDDGTVSGFVSATTSVGRSSPKWARGAWDAFAPALLRRLCARARPQCSRVRRRCSTPARPGR
ncbi:MAG: hypothetical protein H6644_12065 [Caldilineaceae bacterium]|nr:hypothetical protein [Caldilineaceae bacterium]